MHLSNGNVPTTRSLKLMEPLKNMSANASKSGDGPNTILTYLQRKGWDVENRLYLGFGRRRVAISVVENESSIDTDSTTGHDKTQ
jgi:hypothetical protein